MITVRNGEYLGLPVPTIDEYASIDEYLFVEDQAPVEKAVSALVLARRPLFKEVIEADKVHFFNSDLSNGMTADERDSYENGIQNGYEFMISALTCAYFIRSQYKQIAHFVNQLGRDSIALPVHKISQRDRVRRWVMGECQHELTPDTRDPAGYDIYDGHRDSTLYFRKAEYMEELVQTKISQLGEDYDGQDDDDSQDPRAELLHGFNHGAANCVEVYIQSHEQRILNKLC